MNGIIATMENQLGKCRKLLAIFQTERRLYNENRSLGVKDLLELLRRKKEIVEAFEEQQNILKGLGSDDADCPPDFKEKKKTLIRDLSEILEQLLVIDRENEKIIRDMLNSSGGSQPRKASPPPPQAPEQTGRPALQTRLPFVPGASFQKPFLRQAVQTPSPAPAKAVFSPAAVPTPQPQSQSPKSIEERAAELSARVGPILASNKKTENIRKTDPGIVKYRPKSFLRGYAEASQILQLSSKYA